MTPHEPHLPLIDARVSLGNVLTIIVMLIGLSASWANLSSSLARQEQLSTDFGLRLAKVEADHDTVVLLAAEIRAAARLNPGE